MTKEQAPQFGRGDLDAMMNAIISDLKHHEDEQRREPTNANIRRDVYRNVILTMNDTDKFHHEEKVDTRMGIFIKGYVRDVWEYLEKAYDLVHGIDFETEYAEHIRAEMSKRHAKKSGPK